MRITAILIASVSLFAQPPQAPKEAQGIPPRATPADYMSQGKSGTLTVAAEFMVHSIPTPQGILTTEDYVVVEVGLFGPTDTRMKISYEDFSLRINDKKAPTASQPYGMVVKSAKDPDYDLPTPEHSKTGISTSGRPGGKGPEGDIPPVVHIPVEIQRGWEQRLQKASLPEGERLLPQAGFVYFPYHGKAKSIHSLELIYNGAGGKATIELHP